MRGLIPFFWEKKTGTYLPDCCGDFESRVGGGGRHAYDYASLQSYLRELPKKMPILGKLVFIPYWRGFMESVIRNVDFLSVNVSVTYNSRK